jgi:hypothetical protein
LSSYAIIGVNPDDDQREQTTTEKSASDTDFSKALSTRLGLARLLPINMNCFNDRFDLVLAGDTGKSSAFAKPFPWISSLMQLWSLVCLTLPHDVFLEARRRLAKWVVRRFRQLEDFRQ